MPRTRRRDVRDGPVSREEAVREMRLEPGEFVTAATEPEDAVAAPPRDADHARGERVGELASVPGVGAGTALDLARIGVGSVRDLSRADPGRLADSLYVDPRVAERWVQAARSYAP